MKEWSLEGTLKAAPRQVPCHPCLRHPGTEWSPQFPLRGGFFQPELDGRREAGLFQIACALKTLLH